MPESWSRRRTLRAIATAAPLVVAGCSDSDAPGTSTDGTGTDRTDTDETTTAPTGDGDRPTSTERDPRPLDVAGTWHQFGAGAGHTGVTDVSGVPEDGEPYWHLRRIRSGPPVLADGRLFHYAELNADSDGRPTVTREFDPLGTSENDEPIRRQPALVARDVSDGRIEWSRPLPDLAGGWPAVADGRVVAPARGEVAAFDPGDGSLLWRRDVGNHNPGDPTASGDAVVVPFSGSIDGETGEFVRRPSIRAYALADGEERWSVEPPKRQNDVAVGANTAVVVSGGWDGVGVVLALSLADGSEDWRRETAGDAFEEPVVADGTVYVASIDGHLQALALADGSERWRRDFDRGPNQVAVDGETVYVPTGSSLYALRADDGATVWQVSPAPERTSVRTVAAGSETVYVGAEGDVAPLVALNPADGQLQWRHDFPNTTVGGDQLRSGVESQPVVADGGVFVNAVDGLYAFGPADS